MGLYYLSITLHESIVFQIYAPHYFQLAIARCCPRKTSKNILEQLVHATAAQIETFICGPWWWNPSYTVMVKKVAYDCLRVSAARHRHVLLAHKARLSKQTRSPVKRCSLLQQHLFSIHRWWLHQKAWVESSSNTTTLESDRRTYSRSDTSTRFSWTNPRCARVQ